MAPARLVPVDVPGLDLVLGGGVPVLGRASDGAESAVILVRGAPGSGKTVLGAQLAGALARAIVPGEMVDVAYACLTLLPADLAAQHAGLASTEVSERVVLLRADQPEPHTGRECRIFADHLALDLDDPKAEHATDFLDRIAQAGGKPRVLVLDALDDLRDRPAPAFAALSRLAAARGIVLVVLEETRHGNASPWSAGADLVIELGTRTLDVTKNRFGRAAPGPHAAGILRGSRYTIWPDPSAYLSGDQVVLPRQGGRSERVWGQAQLDDPTQRWPRLQNQTVAVIGTDATTVRRLAHGIAKPDGHETELAVHLDDLSESPEKSLAARSRTLRLADPHLGAARLLAEIVEAARSLARVGALSRVIIGDTRALRLFSARDEIVQGLAILSSLLREADVPLVFFDSSIPSLPSPLPSGNDLPRIADFADVKIVGWCAVDQRSISATLGAHKRIEWRGFL